MARGRYYFPVARAPRLKERFHYFGGKPNIVESRRRAPRIGLSRLSDTQYRSVPPGSPGRRPRRAVSAGSMPVRAPRLKREIVKMRLCVLTGFPKAREKAAERKRSRSEADTGRRTGASFGPCLFFGWENRLRFSHRAGPSCWLSFWGSQSRRACGGASSMPGPDAAARTPKNWGGLGKVLGRERIARFRRESPSSGAATH